MRVIVGLLLLTGWVVQADELGLAGGQVVTGQFMGFKDHQFIFQGEDGKERRDYVIGVKWMKVDPVKVRVEFMGERMEDVEFLGYEDFKVKVGGKEASAMMLRRMDLAFDSRRVEGGVVEVISHGEEVDIGKALRKGKVNVVFFHYPEAHSSIRQGNYLEVLARQNRGVVILKVVVTGWDVPVVKANEMKSLPQFWFYSGSGRLVRKLTERFTEEDMEGALREARRSP